MTSRGAIPANRMDQATRTSHLTPLAAFVDELRRHERFQAFARALPTRGARLRAGAPAAFSPRSTRSSAAACSSCSPEDADARDAAEAAGWFVGGGERRALPEPRCLARVRARAAAAPRRRALSRARRPRCRRPRLRVGRALAEGLPPLEARPVAAHAAGGRRAGRRRARGGARTRRLRAGRPRRRAWPVRRPGRDRGRVPLDRSGAASRRVLRRRDRAGARLLAVHPACAARCRRRDRLSRRRAARGPRRARPRRRRGERGTGAADRSRTAGRSPARSRVAAGRGAADPGGGGARAVARRGHRARSVPAGAAARASRRSGRRLPRAGSPRRRTSSRASSAPGTGSSSRSRIAARRERQAALLRKVDGPLLAPGEALPSGPRAALRRRAGAPRFVWRELGLVLLPDTQVFRKRPPRADARLGRALASFADLRVGDYVVHEDHGVGKLLGFETKEVASVTRDYLYLAFRGEDRLYVPHEQVGSSPGTSGRTRRRLRSRSSAARRGRTSRPAPARRCGSSPASCSQLYAQRQRAEGIALRPVETTGSSGSRRRSRIARPTTSSARSRRSRKTSSPAPDGPPGLRGRRLRQDGGRRPGRLRGRRQRAPGARPLPDHDPRRAALEHLPRPLPRLPGPRRDGLALPRPGRGEGRVAGVRRGQGRGARRTHRDPLARRDPAAARAGRRRRGAAVRRPRRRSSSARCGSRWTCSRSPRRRSRARCTCRSPACGTSRSSRPRPRGADRSGRRSASTTRSS